MEYRYDLQVPPLTHRATTELLSEERVPISAGIELVWDSSFAFISVHQRFLCIGSPESESVTMSAHQWLKKTWDEIVVVGVPK